MCTVDLLTGRLSNSEIDFDMPGPIPLVLKRHYRSTNIWLGDLGYGWSHTFGIHLWQEDAALIFRGADGRRILFPRPEQRQPSTQPQERISLHFLPSEELPCPVLQAELHAGAFLIQPATEFTFIFDARQIGKLFPWRGIINHAVNLMAVSPGPTGLPARLEDPHGRILSFIRNRDGLLLEVQIAEHGAASPPISLIRYQYDRNRDLIAVQDPAGVRTYEYNEHLMVRHTDRCGGACESIYDSQGRCIRTRDPHKVRERIYECNPEHPTTLVVRDSLGKPSIYEHAVNQLSPALSTRLVACLSSITTRRIGWFGPLIRWDTRQPFATETMAPRSLKYDRTDQPLPWRQTPWAT